MAERLWSYQEIKFIRIHTVMPSDELARMLNERFHNNEPVRTASETSKVRRHRSIF